MNRDGSKLTRSGGGWFYSDFDLTHDNKQIQIKHVRTYSWLVGLILSKLFGVASYISSKDSPQGYYVNTASLLEQLVNSAETKLPILKKDHTKVLDGFLKDKNVRKIQLTDDEIYGVFSTCLQIGNKPALEAKQGFVNAIRDIATKLDSNSLDENIKGAQAYGALRDEFAKCTHKTQEAFGQEEILKAFTTLESKIQAKMLANLTSVIQSGGDSQGALGQAKKKLDLVKLLVDSLREKLKAETLKALAEHVSSEEKELESIEKRFQLKSEAIQERNTFLKHLEDIRGDLASQSMQQKIEGINAYILLQKHFTKFAEDQEIPEKFSGVGALLPDAAQSIVKSYTEQFQQIGANTVHIQGFLNGLETQIKAFEGFSAEISQQEIKGAFLEGKKKLEALRSTVVAKLPAKKMAKLKTDFEEFKEKLPKCDDEKSLKQLETQYQNLVNQYRELLLLAPNEEQEVVDLQFGETMKNVANGLAEVKNKIEAKKREYLSHIAEIKKELATPETMLSGFKNYGIYRHSYARVVQKEDRENVDYGQVDQGFKNLEQALLPNCLAQVCTGKPPQNKQEAETRLKELAEGKKAIDTLEKALGDIKKIDKQDFAALSQAINQNKTRVENLIKSIRETMKELGNQTIEGLLKDAVEKIPAKLNSQDLAELEQGLKEYTDYKKQYLQLLSQSKKQKGPLDGLFKDLEDVTLPKVLGKLGFVGAQNQNDTAALKDRLEKLMKAKAIINQFKSSSETLQKNVIEPNQNRIENSLKAAQNQLKEIIAKYKKNPGDDVKTNLELLNKIVSEQKQFFLSEMGRIVNLLESKSFEENVKGVSDYVKLSDAVLASGMENEQDFDYKEITEALKNLQPQLLEKMFENLAAIVNSVISGETIETAIAHLENAVKALKSLEKFNDLKEKIKEKTEVFRQQSAVLEFKVKALESKETLLSALDAISKQIISKKLDERMQGFIGYSLVKKEMAAISSEAKFGQLKADQAFGYEEIAGKLLQLEAALPNAINGITGGFLDFAKKLTSSSKAINNFLKHLAPAEEVIKNLRIFLNEISKNETQSVQNLLVAIDDNEKKLADLRLEFMEKLPEKRVEVLKLDFKNLVGELQKCKSEKELAGLEEKFKALIAELDQLIKLADAKEKESIELTLNTIKMFKAEFEKVKKQILELSIQYSSYVKGIEEKLQAAETLSAGLGEYALYRLHYATIVSAEKRQLVDYGPLDARFEALEKQALPALLNKIAADQNIPDDIKVARQRAQELVKEQKMIADLKAGVEKIKKVDNKSDFSLLDNAIQEAEKRVETLLNPVRQKAKEFLPEDFDVAEKTFNEFALRVQHENKDTHAKSDVIAAYNKFIEVANKYGSTSEENRKKAEQVIETCKAQYQQALNNAK